MDIVTELRKTAAFAHKVTGCSLRDHACTKAADEIEKLHSVLNSLVSGDVGRKTLDTLETGQGTNTDDGRAWMRASSLIKFYNGGKR